ncbi:hypothetical protein [Stigmatella hybrida]|uniref:hypothetical protein n=1 Tax=Stigmatella hybrida TaxID=394097 RepID=UPI001CDAAF0E|nr:hypothetical protein [Stigmatella hybrida]
MVQVSGHQVVHMVAMGHGFMTTLGAVLMLLRMVRAVMLGGALDRIGRVRRDAALTDAGSFRVVKMSFVEIVHVVAMPHGRVAAFLSVLVAV